MGNAFYQVVRSAATSGAGSTTSGVVSGSLGSREINYILRVLGPAACRNPDIFTEVANCCIRIALPAPRGSGTGQFHLLLFETLESGLFLFEVIYNLKILFRQLLII